MSGSFDHGNLAPDQSGSNLGSPSLVLLLSGKRKCGKDFLADMLHKMFPDVSVILRLSGPLKEQYAKENSLNYEELLGTSGYKEKFRLDMIQWGENKRNADPGYFCRHAIFQSKATEKPIWIVSDTRRLTDLEFFSNTFHNVVRTVRISAASEARACRGWQFVSGIDDVESECGLDSVTDWNFEVVNNSTEEELRKSICPIVTEIKEALQ